MGAHKVDFSQLNRMFISNPISKTKPNRVDDEFELFMAGNAKAPLEIVLESLQSDDMAVQELAIFNPQLEISEAVNHLSAFMKRLVEENMSHLSDLTVEELTERLSSNSYAPDFSDRLRLLREDSDVSEDISLEFEEDVMQYLFDFYLLFKYGTKKRSKFLAEVDESTLKFYKYLEREDILEPYIFWTLDNPDFFFSRVGFSYEHNSEILLSRDSLFDHRSEQALSYSEIWKPLGDVDPDLIINIESGNLVISNTKVTTNDSDIEKQVGFVFTSGLGDGFYPTICFQDSTGQLQALITFFTHMIDSEWLEHKLTNPYLLLETCIPYKVGDLSISESAFFVDSSWFINGPDEKLHLLEFSNIPLDTYSAIEFVGVNPEDPRTWAAGIFRDQLKRNFEVLFGLFPQLDRS